MASETITNILGSKFYFRITSFLVLAIFIYVSYLFYSNDYLDIYSSLGNYFILVSCFIALLLLINLISIQVNYNDSTKGMSEILQETISTYKKFSWYLLKSILIFALFLTTFYFLSNSKTTEVFMNIIFYILMAFILVLVFKTAFKLSLDAGSFRFSEILKDTLNLFYLVGKYVPCAVMDFYRMLQKEYEITGSRDIVLLFVCIAIISSYVIIPKLIKALLYRSSLSLLDEPIYLDSQKLLSNISKVQEELETLEQSFGSSIYDSLYSKEGMTNFRDERKYAKLCRRFNVNMDKLNEYLESNPNYKQELLMCVDDENLFLNRVTPFIQVVNSIDVSGIDIPNMNNGTTYGGMLRTNTTLKNAANPSLKYYMNSNEKDYQFALSFWVNLESDGSQYDGWLSVFNFGDVIEMKYNPQTKYYLFKTTSCGAVPSSRNSTTSKTTNTTKTSDSPQTCESKILYKNNDIKLQKWNNVVLNCDGNILDIYLDGTLIYTTKSFAPFYKSDLITCGDTLAPIQGSICNVRYYSENLSRMFIRFFEFYQGLKTPPV